jgi:hypothetical protein
MTNTIKVGNLAKIKDLPTSPSDNVVRCHGGGWLGYVETVSDSHVEMQIPVKVSDGGSLAIFHHMGTEKIKVPIENVEIVAGVTNIE